tara:strand:- start:95 stop:574 length:480 start_codon:yes stop_codon:yes gene_type:complete
MGICLKGKSRCERDRYNKAFNNARKTFPKQEYDFESWSKLSSSVRLSRCKKLGADVETLRLLRDGKVRDSARSDGYRVDERYKKVYTNLYNEYNEVYRRQLCEKIIDTNTANQDKIRIMQEADEVAQRTEQNVSEQRTLIIAVGGAVLIVGTVLILRKL